MLFIVTAPASRTSDIYPTMTTGPGTCGHGRSRAANIDTCLGGSECPVCFACFVDALRSFDCRGYATFAELVESDDQWDAPCIHLSLWLADPFACECPACGQHARMPLTQLEISRDLLVCRPCVDAGHATATGLPPHVGSRYHQRRTRRSWLARLHG